MSSQILRNAFDGKSLRGDDGQAIVGLFGCDLPPLLLRAAGVEPRDVSSPPACDLDLRHPVVDGVAEPFLDAATRIFLARLARGDFDGLAGLIFPRDDPAAYHAYLYATEIRRQNLAGQSAPPLFLWNMVRAGTAAAAAFNAAQWQRLTSWLAGLPGVESTPSDAADIASALTQARQDAERTTALLAQAPGAEAGFIWRNAARWMTPEAHLAALTAACADSAPAPVSKGPALGLVGSASDDPALYAMLDRVGPLVCDLQPFAARWVPPSEATDITSSLAALAEDPLHLRALPPGRFRPQIIDRLRAAGARAVLIQIARHDEAFGWEVPALIRDLAAHGIAAIDPGLRDFRPSADWLHRAETALRHSAAAPA